MGRNRLLRSFDVYTVILQVLVKHIVRQIVLLIMGVLVLYQTEHRGDTVHGLGRQPAFQHRNKYEILGTNGDGLFLLIRQPCSCPDRDIRDDLFLPTRQPIVMRFHG